jgi:hypothetical protein
MSYNSFTFMPLDGLKSVSFMYMGHMKVKEGHGIDELMAIHLFFGFYVLALFSPFPLKLF